MRRHQHRYRDWLIGAAIFGGLMFLFWGYKHPHNAMPEVWYPDLPKVWHPDGMAKHQTIGWIDNGSDPGPGPIAGHGRRR
jgi:hypothetical protein